MKVFVITLVALLGCFSTAPAGNNLEVAELQSISDMIQKLIQQALDFVCSADIDAFLVQLNLPETVMNIIKMGKNLLCQGRGQEKRSADHEVAELQGMIDIIQKLINQGLDFVCSADVDAILAQLNLPETVMNIITMAKNLLCQGRGQEKRSADHEVAELQSVFEMIQKLLQQGLDFVCSADIDTILGQLELDESVMQIVTTAKTILCRGRGQ